MSLRSTARSVSGAFLILAAAGAALALAVPAAAAMQLGGMRSVSTDDAGVQAAAAFAAGELGGSLASVDSAQQQSAAGTNYRLTITLEDGAVWSVSVRRDLQGAFTLQGSEQTRAPAGEGGETDTGSNDGSDDDDE